MKAKVKDLLPRKQTAFSKRDTVVSVLETLLAEDMEGGAVLDDDGRVLGIAVKNDLLQFLGLDYEMPITWILNKEWSVIEECTVVEVAFQFPTNWLVVENRAGAYLGLLSKTQIGMALLESYETTLNQLKYVLDSCHNGIIAVDRQGIVTHFNPAAERMVGVPASEAIGKHIVEVIPTTNIPEVLTSGIPQYNRRVEFNQGVVAISNRTPIWKDGEVIGVVACFQDLSELELAYKELKTVKDLNKELESILESSYDGLAITDPQGRFIRVSNSFLKMTGAKPEDVLGKTAQDLIAAGFLSDSVSLRVLKERKPVSLTERVQSGKQIFATGNPVFDEEGNIIRIVTNLRDMTELNYLREQVQKASELTERYYQELEEWRARSMLTTEIVSVSGAMRRITELACRVARVDSTVLISGESGVGKEVIAKLIHRASARRDGPFIQINCGAIPENLLESELFGYEKGAFTGANREGHIGIFEMANNGTLLLDEIGEIPLNLQVKLLRAIQEQEIYRVGSSKPIKLNVRIIAATNKDLPEMVRQRKFREDLFYRLNVVPMEIPPLRERPEDIVPLLTHFLQIYNEKYHLNRRFSEETFRLLEKYSWPGNVRELQNLVERLIVTSNADVITPLHLPPHITNRNGEDASPIRVHSLIPLKDAEELVEKALVTRALQLGKSTRRAAELLGVTHTTIIRKLNKYRLNGTSDFQVDSDA